VDPAEGEAFDPATMEAMMRVSVDDASKDDQVSQVFQKGYLFQGHLVRPARVGVYKAD
jgi:molecular chaperone GrpE